MKYIKKITGERLYLSPMCAEDAETYAMWLNDFRVSDGLGASSRLTSIDGERSWVNNNSSDYQFAIIRAKDDTIIGNCGIQEINRVHQYAEVGLFIGDEENRGKGYGSEALKLLVNYAFNYLNLNNIMLKVFSFNNPAINCYKKIGFKEMGRRRQCYFLNGSLYDEIYMDILRSEWNESNPPCQK